MTNHSGNERFRELIYSEIKAYAAAENKTAKSAIIFRVLQEVKNGSPETGGFVKQDSKTKRWFAVEDATGRTTTAQAFRDALSSSYKSSKQFKQQRRWDRRSITYSSSDSAAESVTTTPAKVEIPMPAISGNAEFLPKLPDSFSASTSIPPLDAAVGLPPAPADSGLQLGDILNSALETVEDMTPFPAMSDMDLSPTCGEQRCTKEVDLNKLVDLLGVSNTSNPFEPTPISPSFATQAKMGFPSFQKMPSLPMKEEKEHCGQCWETTIQDHMLDNYFWQDTPAADQAASGFSLKHALTSCRNFPL